MLGSKTARLTRLLPLLRHELACVFLPPSLLGLDGSDLSSVMVQY